jgi:hypothetical protein
MRVRVLTFNVWNTEGDPRRLEIINHALRKLDPDLIAFQEVVQSPKNKMLDRLLDRLGLNATHQSEMQTFTPPFAERYGGSALATRCEHRAVEALDLRMAGAADVPWATLAAVVTLPGLGEMLFIAATAAWRPSAEAARERRVVAFGRKRVGTGHEIVASFLSAYRSRSMLPCPAAHFALWQNVSSLKSLLRPRDAPSQAHVA